MTRTFNPISPAGRSSARSTSIYPFLAAAARRATRNLARRENVARERAELATWEGEGGALSPLLRPVASPVVRSMRFAMSGRPAYDSQGRTDIEAIAAGRRGKPPAAFNAGPPPRRRARPNAPTRPMNTNRGGRSR